MLNWKRFVKYNKPNKIIQFIFPVDYDRRMFKSRPNGTQLHCRSCCRPRI
ncbi:hypothetical protein EV10_1370 [Prochlorococcus marinus str. SS51]|nr:hypothetical protein EV04_0303 [Prochlorococcus marinus str. LG]KGG23509.1 hypothetical protein EV09_1133 [Prochlorococcus marinus str. SS35]KGG32255.1 hypothetical protein EV10_1370 [Prochlorococcus marinus str. SS51]